MILCTDCLNRALHWMSLIYVIIQREADEVKFEKLVILKHCINISVYLLCHNPMKLAHSIHGKIP